MNIDSTQREGRLLRLLPYTWAQVEKQAETEGLRVSDLLRKMVTTYLGAQGHDVVENLLLRPADGTGRRHQKGGE